eukprot:7380284-Alexandrium_andersonii.AAC.1
MESGVNPRAAARSCHSLPSLRKNRRRADRRSHHASNAQPCRHLQVWRWTATPAPRRSFREGRVP